MGEKAQENAGELTLLLRRWSEGEREVEGQLLERLYPLLHHLAARQLRREAQKGLRTTELAHEAYLDLFHGSPVDWQDVRHFAALASTVVRRVVHDLARERQSLKRGGSEQVFSLAELAHEPVAPQRNDDEVLALHDAIQELSAIDPEAGRVVELRFFGGLEVEDIACCCGLGVATVGRRWRFARAWLRRRLES